MKCLLHLSTRTFNLSVSVSLSFLSLNEPLTCPLTLNLDLDLDNSRTAERILIKFGSWGLYYIVASLYNFC